MSNTAGNIKTFAKDWGLLAIVSFFLTATYGDFKNLGNQVASMSENIAVMTQQYLTQSKSIEDNTIANKEQDQKINKLNSRVVVLETTIGINK